MSAFAIEDGVGGPGTGTYGAGRLTLANGEVRGIEVIAHLATRDSDNEKSPVAARLPGFLDTVRGILPTAAGLPMPARLAVSTVRAGLGVIEEGLAPEDGAGRCIEIGFTDGTAITARMTSRLAETIGHDREIAAGVLARVGQRQAEPPPVEPLAEEATDALTSIFRYEKRNGRLRRVAEPGPSSES